MSNIQVKSFLRNGKLVKSHNRKNDRNKKVNPLKVAGGLAITGGVGYLALKGRYIRNLNTAAKQLSKRVSSAPKVSKRNITFTVGGFTYPKDIRINSERQGGLMKSLLRRDLPDNAIIAFDSAFDSKSKDKIKGIQKLLEAPIRGNNSESIRLAQQIFDYSKSNPGKPVSIIAYSAGSTMAEDASYMLKKAGVDVKLVTIGGMDFKFTPKHSRSKSLHFTNKADIFYKTRKPNSFESKEAKGHGLKSYFGAKDVMNKLKEFLT